MSKKLTGPPPWYEGDEDEWWADATHYEWLMSQCDADPFLDPAFAAAVYRDYHGDESDADADADADAEEQEVWSRFSDAEWRKMFRQAKVQRRSPRASPHQGTAVAATVTSEDGARE